MIFITGDCHGDWSRLQQPFYSEPLTSDDTIIVCGDFGIWDNSDREKYNLDQLAELPFRILFCDGNHENFDILNNLPEEEYCGGMIHRIRDNVFHLMRGYIFNIEDRGFFVFGGAQSHDIRDGILDPADYPSINAAIHDFNYLRCCGRQMRIKNLTWWEEELPDKEEKSRGLKNIREHGGKVDYVITHGAPCGVVRLMGYKGDDALSQYLMDVEAELEFRRWYFGHYHINRAVNDRFICLYERIERIV